MIRIGKITKLSLLKFQADVNSKCIRGIMGLVKPHPGQFKLRKYLDGQITMPWSN